LVIPAKQPAVQAAAPQKQQAGNALVKSCSGRYPYGGLDFVLQDGTRVMYRYGEIASDYIGKYILLMELDTDDKMYLMCFKADKNKNRIIDGYEAKDLYRSVSLSGQR
jgi:hypothetical protein